MTIAWARPAAENARPMLRPVLLTAGLLLAVAVRWAAVVSNARDGVEIGLAFGIALLGVAFVGSQRVALTRTSSVWIGVGVEYCSSVSARVIAAARPKSLNEVKIRILCGEARAKSRTHRGVLETPRLIWAANVKGNSKSGPKPLFWFLQAATPRPAQQADGT